MFRIGVRIAPPQHFLIINVVVRLLHINVIYISAQILSICGVDLNQCREFVRLQHHLFHGERLVIVVHDGQADGTQRRGQFQVRAHDFLARCTGMYACITDEELVLGVCLSHVRAVLHLLANAVYGLAVALVVSKRESEEVVTLQNLGSGFPSAVCLSYELIVRAGVIHELVPLRPRLFGPFLQVVKRANRRVVVIMASDFVHQQGADFVIFSPLVFAVKAQTRIRALASQHIQSDIHRRTKRSLAVLDALPVANEIVISTSSEQRHKRCRHQYMFCSHFA